MTSSGIRGIFFGDNSITFRVWREKAARLKEA
jgi:hypothetical protein